MSADGERVVWIERASAADAADIFISDRGGRSRRLSAGWGGVRSIAWAPSGDLWLGGSRNGVNGTYAVNPRGQEHAIGAHAGAVMVHDVDDAGRALLLRSQSRQDLMVGTASGERNVSWFDFSILAGLTADGRGVLFSEGGLATGGRRRTYFRNLDAAAAHLHEGAAVALSRDGSKALIVDGDRLLVVPVGAGDTIQLKPLPGGRYDPSYMMFLAGDQRIFFFATEPERGLRGYVQEVPFGEPRPITGEVRHSDYVSSPDGRFVIISPVDGNGAHARCPIDGGPCDALPATLTAADEPVGWSTDGRHLFVRTFVPGALASDIRKLDLLSGSLAPWRTIRVAEQAGATGIARVMLTPDGATHAYVVNRVLGDLFLGVPSR